MLVYAVSSALVVYLIRPILDELLPNQQGLRTIALSIVGLYFLKGLGSYFSGYLMEDIGQRVVMDLRDRLYGHILGQSASFFARNTVGQLLSRVSNDVGQVQRAVSETAGDLSRESLALVGYAAILFWIDWRLAMVCFTGAPIVVYPLVRLGQRIRRTARRSQEAQEHMTHVGAETFAAHRIVKAFGAEEREASRFREALRYLYRTNMRVVRALSVMPPAMELLGGIGMAAALWYGSEQIAAGRLTAGDFTAFLAALLMMYAPAKKLSRVNANIQQAIAAADRIFEMLDTHTEVDESPTAQPLPPFASTIEFRDVTFAYEDVHPRAILRNITFRGAGGADGGHRRAERRRQDHAGQPDSALLRRQRRHDYDRRARHPRRHAQVAAGPGWHRHSGDGALRRHDREQHRVRVAPGCAGRDRSRRQGGARARVHRGASGPVPDAHRRAGTEIVGWATPACWPSRARC